MFRLLQLFGLELLPSPVPISQLLNPFSGLQRHEVFDSERHQTTTTHNDRLPTARSYYYHPQRTSTRFRPRLPTTTVYPRQASTTNIERLPASVAYPHQTTTIVYPLQTSTTNNDRPPVAGSYYRHRPPTRFDRLPALDLAYPRRPPTVFDDEGTLPIFENRLGQAGGYRRFFYRSIQ